MHVAIGITLRSQHTGEHCKITELTPTHVRLHVESDGETTGGTLEDLPPNFEEFGPTYEYMPDPKSKETPAPVALSRCPFCGSTHLDAAAWSRGGNWVNGSQNDFECGPGCMDCGATAETPESWNQRYAAPVAHHPV